MIKEEYEKLVLDAKKNYSKTIEEVNIRFSKENNPYKIGDIIADSYKKIKIKEIEFGHMVACAPTCLYIGLLLKKDETPRKDGKRGNIWQYNIKDGV